MAAVRIWASGVTSGALLVNPFWEREELEHFCSVAAAEGDTAR